LKAINHNNSQQVKQIIQSGADIDRRDYEKGYTPVILATYLGNLKIMQLLIDCNANVDLKANFEVTAFKLAQSQNNAAAVELLLAATTDKNTRTGCTEWLRKQALKLSIYFSIKGHPETLPFLLTQEGVSINQKDSHSCTALIYSIIRGYPEEVKLLIRHCADVDQQGYPGGPTPLTIAASDNRPEIAALLLANNAAPNKTIVYGHTALMFAAGHGNSVIVALLLANNADTCKSNDNDYTASMFAAKNDHSEIVELLTDEEG